MAQSNRKQICNRRHTANVVDRVYSRAEQAVTTTNDRVTKAKAIPDALRSEGVLAGKLFSNSCRVTTGSMRTSARGEPSRTWI